MENPATWTQLHHSVNHLLSFVKAQETPNTVRERLTTDPVLHKALAVRLDLDDVEGAGAVRDMIEEYFEGQDNGVIGYSLPAYLVSQAALIKMAIDRDKLGLGY